MSNSNRKKAKSANQFGIPLSVVGNGSKIRIEHQRMKQ